MFGQISIIWFVARRRLPPGIPKKTLQIIPLISKNLNRKKVDSVVFKCWRNYYSKVNKSFIMAFAQRRTINKTFRTADFIARRSKSRVSRYIFSMNKSIWSRNKFITVSNSFNNMNWLMLNFSDAAVFSIHFTVIPSSLARNIYCVFWIEKNRFLFQRWDISIWNNPVVLFTYSYNIKEKFACSVCM